MYFWLEQLVVSFNKLRNIRKERNHTFSFGCAECKGHPSGNPGKQQPLDTKEVKAEDRKMNTQHTDEK